MRFLLAFIAIAACTFSPRSAQAQDDPARITFSVGTDAGWISAYNFAALGAHVTATRGQGVLSARALVTSEPPQWGGPRPYEWLWEFGLLAGMQGSLADEWVAVSAKLGLSVVRDFQRGQRIPEEGMCVLFCSPEYERRTATTFGIPLEAKVLFSLFRYGQVGVQVVGNLNRTHSFGGVLFTLKVKQVERLL